MIIWNYFQPPFQRGPVTAFARTYTEAIDLLDSTDLTFSEWILSRDWECLLPFSAGEPITIPEPGAEMSLEVSVNKIKAIWQLCGNILREVLEKENLKSGKF